MKKVTEEQKKALLKAFERLWSKKAACAEVGIHRRTWWKLEEDPKFKEAAEYATGKMVRVARGIISDLIRAGNLRATIFFLKHYDPALANRRGVKYEEGPPPIPLEAVSKEELDAYIERRKRERMEKIK